MNFEEYYSNNKNNLHIFCEVGVYFWNENGKNYSRLSQQVDDNKKVILVEPLPRCVDNIKLYTENKKNVILYPYAISNHNGETTIYDQGAGAFIQEVMGKTPHDVFWANNEIKKGINIKTVTFDQIDPGNIDVLFIDTEGSEYFVLENLKSKPKIIAIETHYNEYNNHYINPYMEKIQNWMDNNNYNVWYTTESDTYYINN